MDAILVIEMLTNEIITEFRLPRSQCRNFIYRRIERAYGAGYDFGRKTWFSNPKPVIQMDMMGKTIKVWDSAAAAAKYFDVDKSVICKYAKRFHEFAKEGFKTRYKNKHRTVAGYVWKYVDKPKN